MVDILKRSKPRKKRQPRISAGQPPTLLSQSTLHDALWRERARTDRSGSPFSLVVIRLYRQCGHDGKGKGMGHSQARTLRSTLPQHIRSTDQIGWFDDRRVGLVLPDTGAEGAWIMANRYLISLRGDPRHKPDCRVYTYPGDWLDQTHHGNGHGGGNGIGSSTSSIPSRPPAGSSFEVFDAQVRSQTPMDRLQLTQATLPDLPNANTNEADPMIVHTRGKPAWVQSTLSGDQPSFASANHAPPIESLEPLMVEQSRIWKRPMDVVGATIGLVIVSPLMLSIALIVKWTSPGPVWFAQRRCGLGGEPFTIFKFRTMVADAEKHRDELAEQNEQDGPAFKMDHDPRITGCGRFLRKTSLDELPQLVNVLRGDMSLVGPRPLPVDESNRCEAWHRRRLTIKPGITCLWQIGGRSTVSFDHWMRMDQNYLRRHLRPYALAYDLWLIVSTIPAVLLQRGAK